MLIKELILNSCIAYKNLKVKDAEELKGFLKVQFLESNTEFEVGDIVYINKDLIGCITPDSNHKF